MQSVLNPLLFKWLQEQFGEVRICHGGESRRVEYSPSPSNACHLQPRVVTRGEQYRINCPFCGDQRHRLYISYQHGQVDPVTGKANWRLWYCHNETECHRNPTNRTRFRALTTPSLRRQARSVPTGQNEIILQAQEPPKEDASVRFELPAGGVLVCNLAEDHPAKIYLRERGFDPTELAQYWSVQYVPYSWLASPAANRLLIPIYRPRLQFTSDAEEQILVAWQARFVGTPVGSAPKYLFPENFEKSKVLYGLPQALGAIGPVVLCEGSTDVWKVGPGGVASFGKAISLDQQLLLLHRFRDRPIVIFPDADALDSARQLVDQLRARRALDAGERRVVIGALPEGRNDPGECTREEIWQAVSAALGETFQPTITWSQEAAP